MTSGSKDSSVSCIENKLPNEDGLEAEGHEVKKILKYDKENDVRDGQATSRDILWQKKQKNQLHLRIKTKRMKRKRVFNNRKKKYQEKESDDPLTINERQTPQKLTGCDGPCRSVAKRSYPSPKVKGVTAQQQPRGATSCPTSGAAAKRSYPTPEVRGGTREEQPHIQGAAAARAQEGREELLHVQGQEGRP